MFYTASALPLVRSLVFFKTAAEPYLSYFMADHGDGF